MQSDHCAILSILFYSIDFLISKRNVKFATKINQEDFFFFEKPGFFKK